MTRLPGLSLVTLFLAIGAAAINWVGLAAPMEEGLEIVRVTPRPFIEPMPGLDAYRFAVGRSTYYVLDSANHRVLVLDQGKKVTRQIGQIGQDPGAFYYPAELETDDAGHLYVLDNVARRLQVLDDRGQAVREFTIRANVSGFAVSPTGSVLVGDPQSNALVAEYDATGRLRRRFGSLHRMSDFYGSAVRDLDDLHRFAANRVLLAVDRDDNVYVAFANAPAIQKYDKNRRLVFDNTMGGDRAAAVLRKFAQLRDAPTRHGLGGDGVSGPLIATSLAVNKTTGMMYVVLQWDDSWIYIADANGQGRAIIEGERNPLRIRDITVDESRGLLIASRFSMRRNNGRTFEIPLPAHLR